MRGTLFVFAKTPRAGAVKTRLGADIGDARAAALFRIMIDRTLGECARGPWRTRIAVDRPAMLSRRHGVFPAHFDRMHQGRGDLGRRMARALAAAPPGPAVIIGADAPGLRARHLRRAFAHLRGADAVFGPAGDGGFWLMGLARRRAAPHLFEGVRWSSPAALRDCVASLPKDFDIHFLDTLCDIDKADDLDQLRARATAR